MFLIILVCSGKGGHFHINYTSKCLLKKGNNVAVN